MSYYILKNLEDKLPFIGHFHVAGLEGRGFPEEDGAIDYRSFFRSVPEDKFHGYVGMEFLTEHPEHDLALAAKRLSPIDPQNRKINWSSPDEGRADAGGTLFRF